MTDERAREIEKIFEDNFAMAKNLGADNTFLALAAATVYTIDDLLAAREREKTESLRDTAEPSSVQATPSGC